MYRASWLVNIQARKKELANLCSAKEVFGTGEVRTCLVE
jgi:hypothetical protein